MDASQLAEHAEISGTYRLTRLLGQGGMGAVWEAEHMRLPKRVAIKFLLGPGLSNPEILARFRREAEIASRLQHPNIVEVHDYNTLADGTPYLVMERLQGCDLRARLEEGRLSLADAQVIVRQIVSALTLAHREGVVHRDLKPENIFLCNVGDGTVRVKVLDFGISKLQDSNMMMTQEHTILGTPNYMAPEQAMGQQSRIDARTDLFALAVIFYEMLTGETIFGGQTLVEVLYKVTHYEPTPLSEKMPEIPAAISTAVSTALSKDPGLRQASVQQFITAIDLYSATGPAPGSERLSAPILGATMVATPSGSRAPTAPSAQSELLVPPPAKRSRPALWTAVALGLGVAIGGVVWVVRRPLADTQVTLDTPSDAAEAENKAAPGDSTPAAPGPTSDAAPPPADTAPSADPTTPQSDHAPTSPSDSAAPSTSTGTDAGATPPTEETSQGPAVATPDRDPSTDAPANERTTASTDRASTRPSSSAPLPEVLVQAKRALAAGNFAEAIRLAKRSLQDGKHPQAYAVMTESYCAQKDIGLANAMARNLARQARSKVKSACRKHGVELQ